MELTQKGALEVKKDYSSIAYNLNQTQANNLFKCFCSEYRYGVVSAIQKECFASVVRDFFSIRDISFLESSQWLEFKKKESFLEVTFNRRNY